MPICITENKQSCIYCTNLPYHNRAPLYQQGSYKHFVDILA